MTFPFLCLTRYRYKTSDSHILFLFILLRIFFYIPALTSLPLHSIYIRCSYDPKIRYLVGRLQSKKYSSLFFYLSVLIFVPINDP